MEANIKDYMWPVMKGMFFHPPVFPKSLKTEKDS